jgi:uncharacterized iron-regulated membrane protein
LFAATTGFLVAVSEFFGEAEALREATRDLVSPVTAQSPAQAWSQPITIQFKGDRPTVSVFTGKPTGGEDRRFVVDARTGALVRTDTYADKPFLHRLHSAEAFGDGGLVVAMIWAFTLVVLTITGLMMYFKLMPRKRAGLQRVFW